MNKRYFSVFEDKQEGGFEFTTNFFNSTEFDDMPPYNLKLENNTICLVVTELYDNLNKANIALFLLYSVEIEIADIHPVT